jgi:hypothetical protein
LFYADLNNVTVIGRPLGYLTRDFHRYGGASMVAASATGGLA